MSAAKTVAVKQPKNSKKKATQQKNSKRKPTSASWQKGQSGNPAGRPPLRDSLAVTFRDFLDGRDKSGRIRKKKLAQCLYAMAIEDKSVAAARLLKDTVAGVELEERFAALEAKVQALVSGTKYASY